MRLRSTPTIAFLCLLLFFNCKPDPSCTDAKQNQGESGVDCGGPCIPCGTCSDGVQNQNETAVDCGGVCSVCKTCSDGIQNQGETDVDCGGPCAACKFIYPQNSLYGINILRKIEFDTNTVLKATPGFSVGFCAQVPKNSSLKIVITNQINSAASNWTMSQSSYWTEKRSTSGNALVASYFAGGPVTADNNLMNVTGNLFHVKVEYYENNSSVPVYSKLIKWKIN